ncbi:MAG: hypothetical protein ACLPY5_08945 [Candidatus Bathyarchaeia archaeon]
MTQHGGLSAFFQDALAIIEAAKQNGIEMRLMGATAIYYRCPGSENLNQSMNRTLTDLDFVTLSKYISHIPDLFSNLGYDGNERVNTMFGLTRQIYTARQGGRHVDVFMDKLSFSHVIDLTRRLEIDPVTLTLADLLLEKMQIAKINEKDLKDTVILLLGHELSDKDGETINAKYVAKLLSDDWGFYYTVTNNLKTTRDYAERLTLLSPEEKTVVTGKIDALLDQIEKQGKSIKWRIRAKAGTRMPWYDETENVENR